MNVENSAHFGNYLIHGIDEIVVPDPISLWPSTIGWKVLGLALMIYALYKVTQAIRRWWRDRYRREALHQLSTLAPDAQLAALPFLLKATALQAYPREQVAALSGEQWLGFLDAHCAGVSFQQGIGKSLLVIDYLPHEQWQLSQAQANELIGLSRRWIEQHV